MAGVPRTVEAVIALVLGRELIGLVTGESAGAALWPLLDWRWAFAVPAAVLLGIVVELLVDPDFLE